VSFSINRILRLKLVSCATAACCFALSVWEFRWTGDPLRKKMLLPLIIHFCRRIVFWHLWQW
jgi:hypothetical protein